MPMVRYLVENGANIHAEDKRGFTPLDWAEMNESTYNDSVDVAKYLREALTGSK